MLLDPTIIAAIAQASPWAAVAGILAWGVVVFADGKTGMRAVRAELREVRVQLEREKARADRMEHAAMQDRNHP
jgi:hypothetical protein